MTLFNKFAACRALVQIHTFCLPARQKVNVDADADADADDFDDLDDNYFSGDVPGRDRGDPGRDRASTVCQDTGTFVQTNC